MNYAIRSNAELAKFAADRHLKLNTGRRGSNATLRRRDYIKALRRADKTRTFRFLDLLPEMRNRVYGKLLVFKDSFTCQPNVLATCRQIKKEATGVLYGDNLVEIKIWQDGVYANGSKCGDYNPSSRTPAERDFTMLRWPEFLKRVHFIGFKLGADFVDRKGNSRSANIENVFYSLCVFLSGGHSLSSLEVDLTRKSITGLAVTTPVELQAALMLGPLKQCTINGEPLTPRFHRRNAMVIPITLQHAHNDEPDTLSYRMIRKGVFLSRLVQAQILAVGFSDFGLAATKWGMLRTTLQASDDDEVALLQGLFAVLRSFYSGPDLPTAIETVLGELRLLISHHDMAVDHDLMGAIDAFLDLEIFVKACVWGRPGKKSTKEITLDQMIWTGPNDVGDERRKLMEWEGFIATRQALRS